MNRPNGFSLIEILVAVGIMGVVSLALGSLLLSMNHQVLRSNLKFDHLQLATQIDSAVRNPPACHGIMNLSQNSVRIANSSPPPVINLNRISNFDKNGGELSAIVPALNTPLTGTRLQVSSMRLTHPDNPDSGPLLAGPTNAPTRTYLADLIVIAQHDMPGAPQLRPIIIEGLVLNVSGASNAVEACASSSPTATDAFVQNGNSFSGLATLGTNDNFALNLETNNEPRMTITNDGKVGVGTAVPSAKLEVAGEIKLGSTSSPCNPASKGQVRYNDVKNVIEFCNGAAEWAAVGNPPGTAGAQCNNTGVVMFLGGWPVCCRLEHEFIGGIAYVMVRCD